MIFDEDVNVFQVCFCPFLQVEKMSTEILPVQSFWHYAPLLQLGWVIQGCKNLQAWKQCFQTFFVDIADIFYQNEESPNETEYGVTKKRRFKKSTFNILSASEYIPYKQNHIMAILGPSPFLLSELDI